jgi:hypothetical protein
MATRTRGGAGRRSERRSYWQAQIEAHHRSGLSQVAFCARHGLRTGTFSFWKWQLKRGAGTGGHPPPTILTPAFIPIRVTTAPEPRGGEAARVTPAGVELELTLGLGRCLRVRGPVEPTWLVQVLRGLEAPGC